LVQVTKEALDKAIEIGRRRRKMSVVQMKFWCSFSFLVQQWNLDSFTVKLELWFPSTFKPMDFQSSEVTAVMALESKRFLPLCSPLLFLLCSFFFVSSDYFTPFQMFLIMEVSALNETLHSTPLSSCSNTNLLQRTKQWAWWNLDTPSRLNPWLTRDRGKIHSGLTTGLLSLVMEKDLLNLSTLFSSQKQAVR
jgi:hypothetical protein